MNRTSISFLLSTPLSPESSFLSVSSVTWALSVSDFEFGVMANAKLKIQTSKQTPAHTFLSLRGRQKRSEAIKASSSKTKLVQSAKQKKKKKNPNGNVARKKLTAYTETSKKRFFSKKSSVTNVIIVRLRNDKFKNIS